MYAQIEFYDIQNGERHHGILLENGDVLCACCGGIFEADEQGATWELIEVHPQWRDYEYAY